MNNIVRRFFKKVHLLMSGSKDTDDLEYRIYKDYGIDMPHGETETSNPTDGNDQSDGTMDYGRNSTMGSMPQSGANANDTTPTRNDDLSVPLEKVVLPQFVEPRQENQALDKVEIRPATAKPHHEDESEAHAETGRTGGVDYMNLVGIINEFDNFKNRISDAESVMAIEFMQQRLITEMGNTGCRLIADDKTFSNDRHVPIPLAIVEDGAPINSFKRPGVIHNGKVILKACVTI